jgi:hypothetical protein
MGSLGERDGRRTHAQRHGVTGDESTRTEKRSDGGLGMNAGQEIEVLNRILGRLQSGSERDRVLARRRLLRKVVAERGYFASARETRNKFAPATGDYDLEFSSLRVKLHVIGMRLDHDLEAVERQRLERRKERITRKLAGRDAGYFGSDANGRDKVKRETIAILDELESRKP